MDVIKLRGDEHKLFLRLESSYSPKVRYSIYFTRDLTLDVWYTGDRVKESRQKSIASKDLNTCRTFLLIWNRTLAKNRQTKTLLKTLYRDIAKNRQTKTLLKTLYRDFRIRDLMGEYEGFLFD